MPIDDAMPIANARMDVLLSAAIAETNRKTSCAASPEETQRVLAKEIYDQTAARKKLVPQRGLLRMFGYNSYSAWMETAPISSRPFIKRTDIFSDLSFKESVILYLSGPCGTVRLGGVLLGTDKLDHFFLLGYKYYKLARRKQDANAGVDYGTGTEIAFYGLLTSRTFSFADLRANYDGYGFFDALLGEDSVAAQGEDGCVVQTRPWSWQQWVDWEYDEVLNPSVHAPIVQWGLGRTLQERKEQLCLDYAVWGSEAYEAHLDAVLNSPPPPYVYGPSPARSDPYQLVALCTGSSVWNGLSPLGDASEAPPAEDQPSDAQPAETAAK